MRQNDETKIDHRHIVPEAELQILLPWYVPRLTSVLKEGGVVLSDDIDVTKLARAIIINLLRHNAPFSNRKQLEATINDALVFICKCPPPFYLLPQNVKTELNLLADEIKQIISAGIHSRNPAFGGFKVLGPAKTQATISKATLNIYSEYEQTITSRAKNSASPISERLLEASRSFNTFRIYLKETLYAALKKENVAFAVLSNNNSHVSGSC